MFDFNQFKRTVKQWVRENPKGTVNDLVDFCEDQIPPAQYAANRWLIEETVSWYKHILAHAETTHLVTGESHSEDLDEECA
jgi:hypothetical protein